jgi:hypothetical protein
MIADNSRPPRFAERLVEWSLPEADREVVLGDLQEEFAATANRAGRAAAVRGYLWQTARSIGSNLIRRSREKLDRDRAAAALSLNDAVPRLRQRIFWATQVVALAVVLLSTYTTNLAVWLPATVGSVVALLAVLLWNPFPSPTKSRLAKARQTRRSRLFGLLLFPSLLLAHSIFPPQHYYDFRMGFVASGIAALLSALWPDKRWPIARASDPADS